VINHKYFVKHAENYFIQKGYNVELEIPLSNGKGAVDIFAYNEKEKVYAEIKSSPSSLNQKKVKKQLEKYVEEFGIQNKYLLISPDSDGKIKINTFNQ